jgi:ATP-dependent RNA helicase SUPV3L1/SUV3
VCQIPDFRKALTDSHTRLVGHCFRHLAGFEQRLPTSWIAGQIVNLDRVDGDIDTLMARIAHIRTWTYITHRGDWVDNATAWQERARAIEDRLSDALHDRITQRFVDRRSAFLIRQLASEAELLASVSEVGEVRVEGTYIGRLDGLHFLPDAVDGAEARTLIAAASRVLREEVAARIQRLAADTDEVFTIDPDGMLRWRGSAVGRLVAGGQLLTPRVDPLIGDFVEGEARERIRQRLQAFLRAEIERRLAPLFAAQALPLGSVGRGLVFQLVGELGCVPRAEVCSQLKALEDRDRIALSRLGLRFGTESIYFEPMQRTDAVRFRALLWAVQNGRPGLGRLSKRFLAKVIEIDPALPASFYAAIGLRVLKGLALRPDRLERLASAARRLSRSGPFAAGAELAALLGVEQPALRRLLAALGYRAVFRAGEELYIGGRRGRRHVVNSRSRQPTADGHPFAKLRELNLT